MNGTETLKYLNKKYGNNGVKFENTGTAIKIINAEGESICFNKNPENEKDADYLLLNFTYRPFTMELQKIRSYSKNFILMMMKL